MADNRRRLDLILSHARTRTRLYDVRFYPTFGGVDSEKMCGIIEETMAESPLMVLTSIRFDVSVKNKVEIKKVEFACRPKISNFFPLAKHKNCLTDLRRFDLT